MQRFLVGSLMAVAVVGGTLGGEKAAKSPAAVQLERLKALAGTWVAADKDGKPTDQVVSVIKVTAAGSAVQETLFPGQPHEMVSIYHLDKGDLVMTHYCALGNQPRMKAELPGGKLGMPEQQNTASSTGPPVPIEDSSIRPRSCEGVHQPNSLGRSTRCNGSWSAV